MTPVEMVLLMAWFSGKVPPARPTVMFGMMPASNWTRPGREMVSATAEPLPSASRDSAAELPSAVALKLPVYPEALKTSWPRPWTWNEVMEPMFGI